MRPDLVLRRHLDLYEIFADSTMKKMFVTMLNVSGRTREAGYDIAGAIHRYLAVAKTYVVEANMNDEITRVAENELDLRVPFGANVAPPSPSGFFMLARPFSTKEVRHQTQLIHAITWGVVVDTRGDRGVLIGLFNDVTREPDEVVIKAIATDPRGGRQQDRWDRFVRLSAGWSPVDVHLVADTARIGPRRIYPTEDKIAEVLRDGDRPLIEGHVNVLHLVLATWKLMSETIDHGEATVEQPPRPLARRARRAGKTPDITVVTLRRLRHRTKNPGTGKPLTYRQEIGGHHRNQAYGPGRALRRKIWVDSFWQGPKDAPVRQPKAKVSRLTR